MSFFHLYYRVKNRQPNCYKGLLIQKCSEACPQAEQGATFDLTRLRRRAFEPFGSKRFSEITP
jgi:hypothetical protein